MALSPVRSKVEVLSSAIAPATPVPLVLSKLSSAPVTLKLASSEVVPTVAKLPPLMLALLKTVLSLMLMVFWLAAVCKAP